MKRLTRTAVVLMCRAWLVSLFGCGGPTVRDKDGSKGRQRRVVELSLSGAADKLRSRCRRAVRKDVRIRNRYNLEVRS